MAGKLNLETNTNNYMTQTIKSFSFNQEEIIENILTLHSKNKRIDVDATYSTGVFYRSGRIAQPSFKFDIKPQAEGVVKGKSSTLCLEDNSINTLMYDPPFIVNKYGKSCKLKMIKRFGCYKTIGALKKDYRKSMQEFQRVLKVGGIVIFKCQDLMYSGTNHMISDWIVTTAEKFGFEPIDKFILLSNKRIINIGIQRHARKYHSYFLIFKKTRKCNNKKPSGIQPILRIKPAISYKSEIFKEAWSIAKLEALRNGGSTREYISLGLKMAWSNYKRQDRVECRIAA